MNVSEALRERAHATAGRWTLRLHASLVSVEVVLTLSLLAGALLLTRSFTGLTGQSIGFNSNQVLTAEISLPASRYATPESRRAFFARALDTLASDPNVEAASLASTWPFGGVETSSSTPDGISSKTQYVTPGYRDALQMRVVSGRFISPTDTATSENVAVANEAFAAKYGGGQDLIGKNITGRTIVGVVQNARTTFLRPAEPALIFPFMQRDTDNATFMIRVRGDAKQFGDNLRGIVRALDSSALLTHEQTLDDAIGKSVASRRFNMLLLASLAGLAILLSVVGIYGVVAFAAGQRRREVGIRIALGAQSAQVQRLVVWQGLLPVLAGVAGGLGGAWFLTTLLTKELFEIRPHDPWTLAASASGFLAVGIAACWIPARRSARINPVEVLRAE